MLVIVITYVEFENGIEDENNFQIQEIDFQNGIDEDDA